MFRFENVILAAMMILFSALTIHAQEAALLQLIHNTADPALEVIDIYLDTELHEDNVEYLDATAFDSVSAGAFLNIGIAPGTSTSAADIVKNFTVTLKAGGLYIGVINGVLNPASFAPNPQGISTGLSLFLKDNAQKMAKTKGNVDFAFLNGSTDAPALDVMVRDGTRLVNDAIYSNISNYQSIAAADYIFDVTDASGSTVIASFDAPLSGLADSAAIIFLSGFLDTDANQNGPGFGMYAALSTGEILELEWLETAALLQLIHNAADPALAVIDIYIDGELFENDVEYLDATAFDSVSADVPLNIGLAPATSTSAADIVKNFTVTLKDGGLYVGVISGVMNPASFAPNPQGISTGLSLFLKDNAQKMAKTKGNVDFAFLNGSTDAPALDVMVRDGTRLVNDATYSNISNYQSIAAADYIFDVTDASVSTVIASFDAPLSGLADSAAIIFLSGFLDTDANQNGPGFGMYAALSTGEILELEWLETVALLQLIHNTADPALKRLDIYLDGELYEDDVEYLDATFFDSVSADALLNIGLAPATSTSAADTLKNFTVTLEEDGLYVGVISGVLNPASFAPNPQGISTGLSLFLKDNAQKMAKTKGNVDFTFLHGATDAPTVDVVASNLTQLVDNAKYSDMSDYRSLPAANYVFYIYDGSGSNLIACFNVSFSGQADSAAILFTSGFTAPAANQNGPEFGLYAAFANALVVSFDNITAVEQQVPVTVTGFDLAQNYPNPFNPTTTICFSLPKKEFVTLKVYNMLGQEIALVFDREMQAGQHRVTFDANNLNTGIYFYQIKTGKYKAIKKMMLLK